MALADIEQTIKTHKGLAIGAGVVVLIGFYAWGKHKKSKAAASSSAAGIDPATGYPAGSPSDLAALQVLDNQPGTSAYPSAALFGTPAGTGSGGGTSPGGGTNPTGTPKNNKKPTPATTATTPTPAAVTPAPTPAPVAPAIPAATATSAPPTLPLPVSVPGIPNAPAGTGSAGVATAKAAGAPFGYSTVFTNPSTGTVYYGLGNPSELAAAQAAGYTITTAKAAGVPGGSTTAKYAYQ